MIARFSLIVVAALAAMALWLAPMAGAQGPALEFVAPEKLAAELDKETSKDFSVWLRNASGQAVAPEFSTALEDSDGEPVPAKVEISTGPKRMGAETVERYRIHLIEASKSSGQLVASGAGIAPASLSVAVAPERSAGHGVAGVLIFSLVAALLLTAICAIWILVRKNVRLTAALGSAELDFSKSFASTLTAVGAILGTIISAGILPEDTVYLSKADFTGLNLTFALAVVVAGVVYSMVQKIVPDDAEHPKEWKLKGFVWTFLLAAAITLWAVFGELTTMWLLFEELGVAGELSGLVEAMGKVLLAAGFLAMLPYTFTRIQLAIRENPSSSKEQKTIRQESLEAAPEEMSPVKLL